MATRWLMPVWSVGTFLTIMNTTMFNVSLPTILADLHITPAMGSLIVSGYSVVYAVSTVIASRLSDILPIRWLITAALALLGTASVLGFAAHSFALLPRRACSRRRAQVLWRRSG